ncbi:E3 ubiquitin-protein ligase RBBP6-like isoform X2 [Strix uralensis]|uniref:E3 ubiquitin-protein ligase RBBP6-like isoform X2 n=1 Tax=Strix uralensis TaxID=36305 RepID=UPI003DA67B8E
MMEVKDPNTKGAMLTKTGRETYAREKKEEPPFLPEELSSSSSSSFSSSSSSSSDDPLPEELLCFICEDIMTDAVAIPCCGNSYCDDCIRTALLESEAHTCPACLQAGVSPDTLIANKCLRQAVNNFRSGTGYTRRVCKQWQQQHQQQPPASPPALVALTPPAALVAAMELPQSSSLSIPGLWEEKVPGVRQPALPSLLGPQGQSLPTTGHPMRAGKIRSASGSPDWEVEKKKSRLDEFTDDSETDEI